MKTKFDQQINIASIFIALLIFSRTVNDVKAQDAGKYKYDKMLWGGYFNTISIKSDWKIVSDVQLRTKDWKWADDWSQTLIRTGVSRKLNNNFSITAGAAHFRYFITNVKTRGEWRPWEELGFSSRWKRWKIFHRLRIEQRFNEKVVNDSPSNEYVFNHRFRYRLEFQYPIYQKNGKQLALSFVNEVMLNAGKNVIYNFDQNRSFAGLTYDLNKKISFQGQLMYIWQRLSNGVLDNISVIRFNILHRINL